MSKNVLIAGGSGLIGKEISKKLTEYGYSVGWLSRSSRSNSNIKLFHWNPDEQEIDLASLEWADYIINLAGAGVTDKRWTQSYKEQIISSRVNSSQLLAKSLQQINQKPIRLISASAIGFYGDCGDQLLNEEDNAGDDFLAEVCQKWEMSSILTNLPAIQQCILRIGVVLTQKGGALKEMSMPTKVRVGGIMGNGKQYISWIHIDDMVEMFVFLIKQKSIEGTFNAVAPNPATNETMTRTIGKSLDKKLVYISNPKWALKVVLGELIAVVFNSTRCSADKIKTVGFEFRYPNLLDALNDIFNNKK